MGIVNAQKSINQELYFGKGAEWHYLDDGSNLSEEWKNLDYDDTSWKTGNATFGYDKDSINTPLEKGFSNYYFRKKVTIDDINKLYEKVNFDIIIDDKLILYINGEEVINEENTIISEKENWAYYNVMSSYFIEGENILAVKISTNSETKPSLLFDAFFIETPLYKDGPYVFYDDQRVKIVTLTEEGGVQNEYHSLNDDIVLTVDDPTSNKTFSFPLAKGHTIPQAVNPLPAKFFATADIEGNFGAYKKMLIDAGIMNENFEWTYGEGHLILSGDMVDRGEHVTEVLWLTYKLQHEAEKAGGKVQFVLGNHEVMVINNDVRYVNKKYIDNLAHLEIDYAGLFSNQTEFGRWMRKKNIIEKVGDYTFVHGGVSPEVANLGLSYEVMNDYGRNRLNQEYCRGECRVVNGGSRVGLYWYRGMGRQTITQEEVDDITNKINSEKVIIGHTIYPQVTAIYQGKVIAIDINHERNFINGKVEALLYEDNCFKQFISDQNGIQKNNLLNNCEKLSLSDIKKTSINIYPNPAKDWIYLEGNLENHIIELYELNGKKLKVNSQTKSTITSIDIANLPKGVYILKTINKETKEINQKKIIKK